MERLGTTQGAVLFKEKMGMVAFGWNPTDDTVWVFFQRDHTNPNSNSNQYIEIVIPGIPHTHSRIFLHNEVRVKFEKDIARMVWGMLVDSDPGFQMLRLGTGPLAPDNVEFE